MDYMPNASGFSTVGPTGKKPHNVTTLYPRSIIVGSRQRELNPDRVRELAMSIKQNGQLQPIGVREEKTKKNGSIATKYRLIFGAHRLAALCLLEDEGLEQNVTVWTTIYPSTYPDNWIKMNELVENLHRLELTPSERSAQTTSYAGWCKKLGLVQKADTNRSMTRHTSQLPGSLRSPRSW